MRAWLWYAAVSAVVLLILVLVVLGLVAPSDRVAVWVAAVVAYPVQLLAFLALVRMRSTTSFVVGWGLGMLLRFAVVAVAALALRRYEGVDPATALVSLVGFVFVLVLVEPIFLRLAD